MAAAVVLLGGAGVWAASRAERLYARVDDGRVVVDEVVGQLVALAPLLATPRVGSRGATVLWVVTGFVAFRLFDIAKPGPVGWAERRFEGGVGVMADDVVAGLLAAAVLCAVRLAVAVGGEG